MGFFNKWLGGSSKSVNTNSAAVSSSTEEKKETTAKKARLVETEGGNKGAELQANQGKSIRRVFGG